MSVEAAPLEHRSQAPGRLEGTAVDPALAENLSSRAWRMGAMGVVEVFELPQSVERVALVSRSTSGDRVHPGVSLVVEPAD